MAVLEAFVYDPLINWRLMQTEGDGRRGEGGLCLLTLTRIKLTHSSQTQRQIPNAQQS